MIGNTRGEGKGGVATHTYELSQKLREKNVNVDLFNKDPKNDHFYVIDIILKFLRRTLFLFTFVLLNHKKYDIVHVQSSGPIGGFLPAITVSFSSILLKIDFLFTYHHTPPRDIIFKVKEEDKSKVKMFINEIAFKFVLINSKKLILVSKTQTKKIKDIMGLNYFFKFKIIPNGFDSTFKPVSKEVARSKLSFPKNKKIIVSVGNLNERKGHKYLIKAIKKVVRKKDLENIKTYIVGTGPLFNNLKQLIQDNNLDEYIELTGWVSKEKLNLILNSSDLFVFPSIKNSESFGIAQLEAMACEKPVVATYNGGSENIIVSKELGFLTEPENPKKLSEMIIKSLKKDWNGKRIRTYVENNYSWEKITEQTIRIYNKLISK